MIGRAPECDVRIEHGSISRKHATLNLDDTLQVTDAGSANGTWVADQRIAPNRATVIRINEAIRLGTVTLIVQRRSTPVRAQRIRSHDYFEDRLEDECARASHHEAVFVVAHVVLADPAYDVGTVLLSALREGDVVARYAPSELEVLLPDAGHDEARKILHRLETLLEQRGFAARVGAAWFPRDGRDASALAARARSRARATLTQEAQAPQVVVSDERMRALHQLLAKVAAADISVLLQGETGVGKEVFAELIHRRSARANAPFMRLNCASFSEALLESELFGYEKGAFTGAVASKPGLLEVAEGGVVFLDEVGELLPATQAKLLRVLDERKVLRVGGLHPRPIDVRIVSATNRDLDAEVRRGAFRLDLMFRLNAMSIIIPPLRERKAEIVPLAQQFLADMARRLDRAVPRLSEAASALLRDYSWPGNVRELRNVIERALILATADVIDVADLPQDKMSVAFAPPPAPAPEASVAESPDAEERREILEALETCAGNQTHAAKLLGVSRRTLINKLEKFALPRPRKR
ncbi:MAG TPA: sigma 54-interacting transcriptional regulator [Kofleriaceae bacterium]|nr:sigma 54-interacting transcriptional regulator [Kofleriaceae bacterium]